MGKINSFEAFVLQNPGINSKEEREVLSQIGNYGKFWHWEGCQGLEKGSDSMEMGINPGGRVGWLRKG